jgi:hypothetical protein
MRRRQLVELEDLSWCPRAVRDGGTDWLCFMANTTGVFSVVASKIRAAMMATGTSNVVDLCSGAGGPWLTLERTLAATGPAHVQLTDRYPNIEAFADVRRRSQGRITFCPDPVDATSVPSPLEGVRTLFNAFHHFPPAAARAILADAVAKRQGIAIFEGINHRGVGLLSMPLQLPAMLLLTPLVRPFRWSRLLLTYLVPLIPLLVLFDGTVSVLRHYSDEELRALVAGVPGSERFDWDIGSTPFAWGRIGIRHVIGIPRL